MSVTQNYQTVALSPAEIEAIDFALDERVAALEALSTGSATVVMCGFYWDRLRDTKLARAVIQSAMGTVPA